MTSLLTWLLAFFCAAAALLLLASLALGRIRARELQRLGGLLDGAATPQHGDGAAGLTLPAFLTRRLLRAGWEPRRNHATIALGVWLAASVAATIAGGIAAGAIAAASLPLPAWAWLEWRGNRNRARLADAMLGLLERIRQLLSVGNALQTALARAVENAPPVMARALAPTLRRINNGAGVADSVERAALELGIYELHMLATAARTNLRFGGPMSAILKEMIETLRRRAAVERELRAHTTQTRASAWVLALLPLLVAGLVMSTNRDYGRWFLDTESGHHMILYAAVSQALGILAMRLITRAGY